MPSSDLHQERVTALLAAIDRSLLLTDDRKAALRGAIPQGTDDQLRSLKKILMDEDAIVESMIHKAIERAVERNDQAFLQSLDQFLHDSMKALRNADEGMEHTTDATTVETLLDAAS